MTAIFKNAISLIVPAEGSQLTKARNDKGGLTKFGISENAFPNVNIQNLTFEKACDIYEENFWNHYGLGRFDSQELANKVFILLINENPYSCIRCLQKAINRCGGNIATDGLLGVRTIQCANSLPQPWLMDRLRVEAALLYISIVHTNPSQLEYLEGWINRALS